MRLGVLKQFNILDQITEYSIPLIGMCIFMHVRMYGRTVYSYVCVFSLSHYFQPLRTNRQQKIKINK